MRTQIDGEVYLIEMKWLKPPVSVDDVSRHLVRVFNRCSVRGIVVSATDFTGPAEKVCAEALTQRVVMLATVEELLVLLRERRDLVELMREMLQAAMLDKKPFLNIMN